MCPQKLVIKPRDVRPNIALWDPELPDEQTPGWADLHHNCYFYRCNIDNILTGCITTLKWKTVKTAQHITRTELSSIQDRQSQWCRTQANRIIIPQPLQLQTVVPAARQYHSIQSHTTRLRDSFMPQANRLLNSEFGLVKAMSQSVCLYLKQFCYVFVKLLKDTDKLCILH